MAVNGLMTAREYDLPIVNIVFNNSALGWVRHDQGDRPIASTFPNYDYEQSQGRSAAKASGWTS